MSKLQAEANTLGKGTFAFAFAMDRLKAERERGITIENSLSALATDKFHLNLIDCPGHRDFLKNMLTGAAQADCAIIIVPCSGREFESAISGGTLKDHIVITGVLGCKKAIVCVNKLDAVPEESRAKRFKEVADELKNILKKNHPDKDPIIIPISGFKGTNLVENGEKYGWFDGWTPKDIKDGSVKIKTLEAAINFQEPPKRPFDKPLRMPIVGCHSIKGVGDVYTGRVDAGSVTPNMAITVQPAGIATEVKTLEIHRKPQSVVTTGQNCGVALKSLTKDQSSKIKPGHVISDANNNPLVISVAGIAKVLITDHKGELQPGYTPTFDISTQHVATKFLKFLQKVRIVPGSKKPLKEDNPTSITKGDTVVAIVMPTKPTAFEPVESCPSLGKFAIRDSGKVIGIGSFTGTLTKEQLISDYAIDLNPKKKRAPGAK